MGQDNKLKSYSNSVIPPLAGEVRRGMINKIRNIFYTPFKFPLRVRK